MNKKIRWITETAVLIALLVILQTATKAGGQFVTGSCVNGVLTVAALMGGLWCGVTVALVSPFAAFLLGIGPQLLPVVPAIAVGNVVFVVVLYLAAGKGSPAIWRKAIAWLAAAVCKFAGLYLLVVQVLCRVLTLPEKQVATLTVMFSWPQLVTALIGGGIALLLTPVLRKALHRL